ncbi:pentapeptide repeat-containing protein [Streptomyces aculeolatus]|uniref:pentapeptide repeat-containing protein n=1 Tax=Streptomyces aculeolatus TaxID=270689 RepID=UPI001CEC63C0|nr:pentapeptide repeat-containing protein [Streptomyces aculeolatus]
MHRCGGDLAEAVTAFGNLHPHEGPAEVQPREPDWKFAEEHFRRIQTLILEKAHVPGAGLRERERRAANAAADVLLALARVISLSPRSGRCPVCRTRDPRQDRAWPGVVVDDPETQKQAEILRGLLYLACPDAPTAALEDTASAIAQRSAAAQPPARAVPPAERLAAPRPVPDRARDLRRAVLTGGDLTSADLRGADLSSADLSDTHLSGTNRTRVDLICAKLSGANLAGTRLAHVNLIGANLSRANLAGTRLTHVNLTGANLSHTDLSHALLAATVILTDVNLSGANLVYVQELPLVPGIEWNADTQWPPDFNREIHLLSDEVRPGVFRVRDPAAGTDHTGSEGRGRPGHAGR